MTQQYLLPVEQGRIFYDNSKRHKSYRIPVLGSHQTYHMHHISQLRFLITLKAQSTHGNRYLTLHPPRNEDQDVARVMVSLHARNVPIRRRTNGSIIHSLQARQKAKPQRRTKGNSKIAKLVPEIGSHRTSNKDFTFANYQFHQKEVYMLHQPTKESFVHQRHMDTTFTQSNSSVLFPIVKPFIFPA